MRSTDYLIQLYPDKTGKEILAIQEQDKLDDQKEFEKFNKIKLKFIKDLNTNGGYYRGRFGLDQYFFYNVTNVRLLDGNVYADVITLVLFINKDIERHSVITPGEMNMKREIKTYQDISKYGLDCYDRITVKEWNEVNEYIDNVTKFWEKL